VFIVETGGGWQPVIELADGTDHWCLGWRARQSEAEDEARHFLATLGAAVARSLRDEPDGDGVRTVPAAPRAEGWEQLIAAERGRRDARGWELVFERERDRRS
jgi:hypothetical protein